MAAKDEMRIVPEKVIDVAQAIAHNTTIIKKTTNDATWRWHSAGHQVTPRWVPRFPLIDRIFRRSRSKTPVEKFNVHFQQLVLDMRYLSELSNHPDVQSQCQFKGSYDSVLWMEWAAHSIYWLEDDGCFPPLEHMREALRHMEPGTSIAARPGDSERLKVKKAADVLETEKLHAAQRAKMAMKAEKKKKTQAERAKRAKRAKQIKEARGKNGSTIRLFGAIL